MLDIFLCSYLYNFSYMMELFLTAIDTKPTIFPLKPLMAHTCVTPYIINFSFWSIWSFSPKYVAVYGIGLTWRCSVSPAGMMIWMNTLKCQTHTILRDSKSLTSKESSHHLLTIYRANLWFIKSFFNIFLY